MRIIISLAIAAGALSLAACNTVEGVGKDVKSAGDTVAKTADKNK
jgi:predicted small secreted protein